MINYKAIACVPLSAILVIAEPMTVAGAGVYRMAAVPKTTSSEAASAHLTAFEHANLSLEDAISTAEGTMGGIVIDANFQISNGRPAYMVRTFLGWDRSVGEEMVDAQSGNLIGHGKEIPRDMLDRREQSTLSKLRPWDVSLGEAVTAAEDYGSAKAISVRLMERNGETVFEVTIVRNASLIRLAVDATDGHVIS